MSRMHKSLVHFLVLICTNTWIDIDCGTNSCFATGLKSCVVKEYDEGKEMVSDIKKYANSEKTIVLWDCDNVLQMNNDNDFREPNIQKILTNLPNERWGDVIWNTPKVTVEDWILNCTKCLDETGVKQFVFTQCSSDRNTRDNRKRVLKKLGYNFFDKAVKFEDEEFNISQNSLQLRLGQTKITEPVYEDGIIYTGSASKGRTIIEFFNLLNKVNIKDFNVIFIDDKRKNIDEVKEACEEFGIQKFYGFHYTFAQNNTEQVSQDKIELYKKLLAPENELYIRKAVEILGFDKIQ